MSKSEYASSSKRELEKIKEEILVVLGLDDSRSMAGNNSGALDRATASILSVHPDAIIVTINLGRVGRNYKYEPIGLTDLTVIFEEIRIVAVRGAKLKVFIVTDGLHNVSSSLDALNSAWQTAEHLKSLGCSLDVKLLLIGSCANYTEYPSYFVFFKALLGAAFTWGIRYEDRILATHQYLLRNGYDDWSSLQSMLLIGAGLNQLNRHPLSAEQREAIRRFTETYAATLAPKAPKAGGLTVIDMLEDADTSEQGLLKAMVNCSDLSGLWSMIRDVTVRVEGVILSAAWKAFILAASKPLQDAIVELKLKDTEMFKALIDSPPGSVHVLSADPAGNLRVCENVLMALCDTSNTVCLPFPAAEYVNMTRILSKLATKNGEQLHPSTNIGHMLNMLLQQLFKTLNKVGRVDFLKRFIIPSTSFQRFYAMNWCRPSHTANQTIADLVTDMGLAQGVAQRSEYNTQEIQYGGHVWMCLMSFFLNCSGKSKADQTRELQAVLVMLTKFGTKYSSSGYELYEFRIDLDQLIAVTGLSLRDLIEMNLLILEPCEVKDDAGAKVVVAKSKLLTYINSYKKSGAYGKYPMNERDYSLILSFWTSASVGATKDCINVVKEILGLAIDCDAIAGGYNAVGALSQNTKYVTNPREYTHGAVLFSKFMDEYGERIALEKRQMSDQHRLANFTKPVRPGHCYYCGAKPNSMSIHLLKMDGVHAPMDRMIAGLFFLKGCKSVGESHRLLLNDGLSLHGKELAKSFVDFYRSEAGEKDLKFLDEITPANIGSANRVTDKGSDSSCQKLANAYPHLAVHRERMVFSASSEYSGGGACAAGNATGGFNATASNSSSCVASVSSGGACAASSGGLAYAPTTSAMLTGGSAIMFGALSGSPSAILAGVRLLTGSGGGACSPSAVAAVVGSNATASSSVSSPVSVPTSGGSATPSSCAVAVSVASGGAGVGSSTVSAAPPSSSGGGGASAASPSANNWGFERDDGEVTNYSAGNQAIIEGAYKADSKGRVSVRHEITQGSKKGTVFEHTINFAKNVVIDATNAESYPLVR